MYSWRMTGIRIQIVGTSCSGKTTLAKKLSQEMKTPHIELDAIHWKSNWVERDTEDFYKQVEMNLQQDSYVVCGNYSKVRALLFSKATHIIWLNYSFPRVFLRALKRTLYRSIFKVKVCNGNVESFKKSFFSKDSILLWVLKTYHKRKNEYPLLLSKEFEKGKRVIELKKPISMQKLIEKINKS